MRMAHGLKMNFSVEDLKKKLDENRKSHKDNYKKALAGWKREVVKIAQCLIDSKDKDTDLVEALHKISKIWHKPEEHTPVYDRAIAMLAMCTDKTIELDGEQFDAFVRDNWDWKDQWVESTSRYLED